MAIKTETAIRTLETRWAYSSERAGSILEDLVDLDHNLVKQTCSVATLQHVGIGAVWQT